MADMLAQIQALKAELLTAMRAADVATVRVEYSGSGDDGCIDSVELIRARLTPTWPRLSQKARSA